MDHLWKMLRFGLRAQIGNISSMLNLRLDQMVMSIFIAPNLLGYYVVGVTYSGGVQLVSSAVATVSFPSLSSIEGDKVQKPLVERFFRLNFWGCLTSGIMLITMAAWLIPLLFGSDYKPALQVVYILTVASMITGMNSVMNAILKGIGKPIVSSYGEMISLGVTIPLLWLLLPRLNMIGAAITSIVAYTTNFIYLFIFLNREYSFRIKDIIFPQKEDINIASVIINKTLGIGNGR